MQAISSDCCQQQDSAVNSASQVEFGKNQAQINHGKIAALILAGGRDSSCASKTDIIPVLHLFHDTRYSAAQLETSPEVSNQISGLLQGLAGCELLKFVSLLEIELLTSLWFL
ncbi:uncharacterized protein PHALS_09074 [Plasmopara halstedii]|uniref:Uncharacterized protein n=1 Tax=Plasmopara halstedii TaxID=4781 RepID=A0A0P1ADD1_PLAHL|nr:uncharacterized protein PHALS_09074 [Plasmopara halstedii]CEG39009.1 hypothetical protein PHALS_09074 [Plasmopara halstedii]|eukprot:XP_024575378.1 hypothetical protein PHALS_09074 [Plasmopara halstedii]